MFRTIQRLFHACRAAGRGVVAVFVICPGSGGCARLGTGEDRVHPAQSRARSSPGWARLNIPLKILTAPDFAGVPGELLALAERFACDALYFNREYEWNEVRRDERVARAFGDRGLSVHAFHDQVPFPPGEIRTQEGRFYTVYSPFKRACWSRFAEGNGWVVLPTPAKAAEIEVGGDEIPDRVPGFGASGVEPTLWAAGEAEAHRRLARFVESGLDRYKEQRDIPGIEGTSTLSPHLAVGVLSPRQCVVPALRGTGADRQRRSRGGDLDPGIAVA